MVEPKIEISREKIADFCKRHHIRKLSLFGSVLRDDFGSESDVDVLVEFEPGHIPGLSFFTMEAELSEILRNRLIHGYDEVDFDILWKIATEDLSTLVTALERRI